MAQRIEIRESGPGDIPAIEELYGQAFPDEDLLPVVMDLLREGPATLSLVALIHSSVVGHIAFTYCSVAGSPDKVALLAPLAVSPGWQRNGIGSALVRHGLQRLERSGVARVYVLGDPAYYGRLGFVPEADVVPPYTPAAAVAWRMAVGR